MTLWIDKDAKPFPEVNLGDLEGVRVNVSCGKTVVIDKLYGPLVFADIRVRAEHQNCEWVIERQRIDTSEWIEVARIPGQIDGEFRDDDEKT
jgi:hypothetical protein